MMKKLRMIFSTQRHECSLLHSLVDVGAAVLISGCCVESNVQVLLLNILNLPFCTYTREYRCMCIRIKDSKSKKYNVRHITYLYNNQLYCWNLLPTQVSCFFVFPFDGMDFFAEEFAMRENTMRSETRSEERGYSCFGDEKLKGMTS